MEQNELLELYALTSILKKKAEEWRNKDDIQIEDIIMNKGIAVGMEVSIKLLETYITKHSKKLTKEGCDVTS